MTCPLCGQRDHDGPCYKDLRDEWRMNDKSRAWDALEELGRRMSDASIRSFPFVEIPDNIYWQEPSRNETPEKEKVRR